MNALRGVGEQSTSKQKEGERIKKKDRKEQDLERNAMKMESLRTLASTEIRKIENRRKQKQEETMVEIVGKRTSSRENVTLF